MGNVKWRMVLIALLTEIIKSAKASLRKSWIRKTHLTFSIFNSPFSIRLTVGWDCGAWFVRDARAGTTVRVLAESGRRKLGWTLSLGAGRKGRSLKSNVFSALPAATLFNPDWNLARVVIRGKDAADALVRSRISVAPLVIWIR